MTDFITRLTELAGAETAAKLLNEFGGTSCYMPVAQCHQAQPVGVVLHGHFCTTHPIAQVVMNLGVGLHALDSAGVKVTSIGIKTRGLGDAYIAALQWSLKQQGVEVTAML